MLPVIGMIGGALAIYGIAEKLFEPALIACDRTKKSKVDAAKFLIEALNFEAENGKVKDVVRRIPIKPGGSAIAYYQIKNGKDLNYLVVNANGDISIKAAEKSDWDWYTSPDSLNRLYEYFRKNFNNSIKGVEGLHVKIEDFGQAAASAIKFPETVRKIGK